MTFLETAFTLLDVDIFDC